MRYKCKLFTLNNELIDGDAECEFFTIKTRRRTTTHGKIYFSKSVPVFDKNFPSEITLTLESGKKAKIIITDSVRSYYN